MTLSPDLQKLQENLGYRFSDTGLLEEALRHSSYVNEQADASLRDNERFEFLGDAVLNLVIGHLLMRAYPHMREGDLSRIRANMVCESQLADLARDIGLGAYLQMGKGEALTGGQDKNSILANAFEALMAAVYLDKGYDAALRLIKNHFKELAVNAAVLANGQDYKSRLQEIVQSSARAVPVYDVVKEVGPDHDKTFFVTMRVGDIETQGEGKSKKNAEQDAARKGLDILNGP